ncbi:L-aspartate oxidase [Gordonia sp. ABSL1-1]|uniref:L-aspartate oxidase n=1 Tax=Gordonia sp. ABSL1-1 TaxID=3053923 RepID=UPI002572A8D8|nr:L-aspartate oxidase [Gordonia sp. ABSL1-1]MDL9935218.1 L-aspartate oxidase [Gordonia sp. ABSL1-1]
MTSDNSDGTVTRADFVVVGAGVAGFTAALAAAERGLSVVVLNKGPRWDFDRAEQSTATFYAQGGVAAVLPGVVEDSVDLHLSDTVAAGGGLTDPVAARPILADGWPAVAELIDLGTHFDRGADGDLLRTREGGHSVRRIVHSGGDATGAAIQRSLSRAAGATSTIDCRDDATVTSVILDGGVCVGVTYLSAGRRHAVFAPSVLLATGGAGQLYAATTNPAGASADGIALALRAGAVVADLEFIQFHPTMLFTPGVRGRRTLISEAVRGEGGRLVDVDGASVTAGVHPMGDLAPRDVVANAVETAIERTGHPCVYLDVGAVDDFARRFPTVGAGIAAAGVEIGDGRIPVVPGAHYLCGGVVTDEDARTSVPGLLAAGEVARTGLHGANRLASNSLLEGLVMGRRAARTACLRRAEPVADLAPAAELPATVLPRTRLQDLMSRFVGLRRNAAGLRQVAEEIAGAPLTVIADGVAVEDASLTLTATAVVAAATARAESRGSHNRTDHPHTDTIGTSRMFRLVDGVVAEQSPVVIGPGG